MTSAQRHRVVIVGGGFAGLACARQLRKLPVDVTLIDRHNYHLFQPLLYQVATGELSPANIASPLRAVLRRQKNCLILMGEVIGINLDCQEVVLESSAPVAYDTLIIAAGANHSYFGNDHWEKVAPGLKTIEQATEIRRRILYAFEAAELEEDPVKRAEWLTFAIVGSGPTGVELAGALSEIAHHMLTHDFRRINPDDATIYLLEAAPQVLGMYPAELSEWAKKKLQSLAITVKTGAMVTDITDQQVTLKLGDQTETLPTRTVLWAAGVAASPLGKTLSESTGVELDRAGRVQVEADLSIASHPNIFVLGDLAHCKTPEGKPLPGLAPVAMQQGSYVAKLLGKRLRNPQSAPPAPFRYNDRGSMAVIGRYSAIGLVSGKQVKGFTAWFLWIFVHLMYVAQFRNRFLVLIQWGWTFLTHDRAARLITDTPSSSKPAPRKYQPRREVPGVITEKLVEKVAEPAAEKKSS